MVYSTYQFILVFLPIVLLVYFGLSRLTDARIQKVFLVLASLFFYGYYNWTYLPIIISSIAANYLVAILMQRAERKKPLLVLGILFNIGLIGYFKYYDFFISNVNALFRTSLFLRNIALPLGISFFTFQQLSFSSRRYFNTENFCQGLYLFAIGAFKKAVIADTVSLFVDNGFAMSGLGLAAGWVTSLSYTFQIYFDFSGYSDMAIGLGKMFNINIPQNFDLPYRSKSISEFWRRWHMTLGRALSTYVYFPLGGSRNGLARTCFNLMLTFLVSGIWHGAAWTFILWGVLHGAFAVLERIFKNALDKIPDLIRKVITFLIVNALWVLFRAESFEEALSVYRGMLNFGNLGLSQLQEIAFDTLVNFPGVIDIVYVLGILLALFLVIIFGKGSMELNRDFELNTKTSVASALCLMISFICMSKGTVFIYFNF